MTKTQAIICRYSLAGLLLLVSAGDARTEHWSFKPISRPPVPAERGPARNPVDAFLLSRLEAQGHWFAPEADRATLIRRLYLDLVGLPPMPAEALAFAADAAPDAYERLVDRLLASPHFGERWGRHWLDLARYAESDGYENDSVRPNAWRYRDWVIDAFNRDLPFDQFTIEQLAGDLLPKPMPAQQTATGLHRNTLWNSAASGDKEEFRTRAIKDRVDTTAAAWLGLTSGCAQCHDHKYDPLSQQEYYQLYAFFNRTDNHDIDVPGGKVPALRAVTRTSFVHKRGDFLRPGEAVEPATPAFLPPLRPRSAQADRLDLARWLVRSDHPLVARVAANHVWQHLFGDGLVPTPENFGRNGEPPSNPELLDWLASELVRGNWSRKALIRTIVLSAAYRQSSVIADCGLRIADSSSNLQSAIRNPKWNVQRRVRVEAEVVRDLALAVSGLLDRGIGGPSVVPPFPEALDLDQFAREGLKRPGGPRRRSVYVHVQRTLTHPSLAAFDAADPNQPCVRRVRSTTPVQALTLLNDPTFADCARALGARLRSASPDGEGRMRHGYLFCLSRPPDAREAEVLRELIDTQRRLGATEEQVWAGVARVLLNLDSFIMRE